ncbi:hypothetical protein [Acetobacter thailandicus]|nr:hypothetical protein [Acetobacter thailandicus]MBS0961479.1 hypothetical protein [Acetobacter thailandicus]
MIWAVTGWLYNVDDNMTSVVTIYGSWCQNDAKKLVPPSVHGGHKSDLVE